ncbi:MAG: cytochrome c oxidase subunit IV [Planctomycetota bacterium]|jgi:cytochrome c oxidase subunit IV
MTEANTHAAGDEHSDDHGGHFSVFKIFITLLVLTALEVAWGTLIPYENKALLWGGLLGFAAWKGFLIIMHFMHFKYEGLVVKGNVFFTIPLVCYLMTMLLPDTAFNDRMNYSIGDQLDQESGEVMAIDAGDGAGGHAADEHAADEQDSGDH